MYDARSIAQHLGIPYYVVNFEQRFEEQVVFSKCQHPLVFIYHFIHLFIKVIFSGSLNFHIDLLIF